MNGPFVMPADELALALEIGMLREWSSVKSNGQHRFTAATRSGDYGANAHLVGAFGELAFCRWRGIYWPATVDAPKTAPDIPPDIQVRTTVYRDGCLLLHRDDIPEHRYVLVVADVPRYWLIGWMWGRDGMRDEWWRDPTGRAPAYFVPQDALAPLGEP